jgi:hypothetical protein
MKNQLYLPLGLLLFALFSCEKKTSEATQVSFDSVDTVSVHLQDIVSELPKSTDVPYIIQNTGADYFPGLCNDAASVNRYTNTTAKAALNLGVYITDLGYHCVYTKTQESLNYFKSVQNLTQSLGLSSAIDRSLVERFEKNINQTDSIVYLVNDASQKTNAFLLNNQQEHLSALVFAGTYIEGLYLSTGIIENYPNDGLSDEQKNQILVNITKLVLEQKATLAKVIRLLEKVKNNQDANDLLSQMKTLEEVYADLNVEQQIKENKGAALLSNQNLQAIGKKVKEIRASIIG